MMAAAVAKATTSQAHLTQFLIEPPSLGTRLAGMGKRAANVETNPEKDPASTAYKDDDLNCVEQIISARYLTNARCRQKFSRLAAKEPLDALCVGDVPMLLRLIRRSAKLGAAEVLGTEVAADAPSEFVPSAWPEGKAEQIKRFNWKHNMHGSRAIKPSSIASRLNGRGSGRDSKAHSHQVEPWNA